jgi:hypothetical protein
MTLIAESFLFEKALKLACKAFLSLREGKGNAAITSNNYQICRHSVVEGHVTKLKLIKRQGYGRAGFPLLRKRVLHAV